MKRLVVLCVLFIVSEQLFSQVISLKDQLAFVRRLRKNQLQKTTSFLFWQTTINRLRVTNNEEPNLKDLPHAVQRQVPAATIRMPLSILFATNNHNAICLSVKKEKAFVPGKGSFNQKSFAALSIKFSIDN
jgi:hypothetical protein